MPKNQKDLDILYPEGKKLVIAGREFVIKPLVFKQRVKLLRIITGIGIDLAKKYPGLRTNNLKIEQLIEPLCDIAGDRMKTVYSILLNVEPEWIEENLDLKSEIRLINIFLEQNDIPFLIGQVKSWKDKIKIPQDLAK